MQVALGLIVISPILLTIWGTGRSIKSDRAVKTTHKDTGSPADWISRNVWVNLENPIVTIKALPGDGDQISIERPLGPIQEPMMQEKDPVQALAILGKHEEMRDRAVVNLWPEFISTGGREIATRGVDQPITSVNILKPGAIVDQSVKHGARFWDQPVPRSTGIDRYYKRLTTVPYYMVP